MSNLQRVTPECHHCGQTVDTAFQTLAERPVWGEMRCSLMAAIGVGVIPLGNMIAVMLRSGSAWISDVSLGEHVMLTKVMAEWDQERYRTLPFRQTREGARYRRRLERRSSQNDNRPP